MDDGRFSTTSSVVTGSLMGPEDHEARRDCAARPPKRDPLVYAAVLGLVMLVSCVAVGVAMSVERVDSAPRVPLPTLAQLSAAGYDVAFATKPWTLAQPQFVMTLSLCLAYILRRCILPRLVVWMFPFADERKQIKIANYILDMLADTVVLAGTTAAGFWGATFNPSSLEPTPEVVTRLAAGMQLIPDALVPVYILQLAFDDRMRFGLILHHIITIGLYTWGMLVAWYLNFDVNLMRTAFVMSLYMSTEQSVFGSMLLYYARVYRPWIYYANVVYYAASRLAISGLTLWTWWAWRTAVFNSGQNQLLAYSMYIFVPGANVLLNITQLTTVFDLLGIAKRVSRRARGLREEERQRSDAASVHVEQLAVCPAGAGGGGGGGRLEVAVAPSPRGGCDHHSEADAGKQGGTPTKMATPRGGGGWQPHAGDSLRLRVHDAAAPGAA